MALTKVTGSVIKDSVSLSGNVSVGGTLTYQDVTNVDALGIGTFRTGIKVLAGQVDVGSNIKLGNAGVITATSFVGSGANLTGITQTTINNNANNRIITGSGTANTLEGEANLTYDGTTLNIIDSTGGSGSHRLTVGNSHDLRIYHDGNSNITHHGAGDLYLTSNNSTDVYIRSADDIFLQPQDGENGIRIIGNAQTELYYDNEKMFQTNQDGSEFFDSDNNCNVYFTCNGTRRGYIFIESTNGGKMSFYDNQNHPMLSATKDAAVDLYYDNSKKLETTSSGVTVTGAVTATSFSGDGSSLTGISAFVTGMIILWSGAANAIPSGWYLCNGSNGTPDLRGRFVVGYHDGNGDYDVNDTGGAETVTLSTSQIPSHDHSFSGSGSSSHSHSFTVNNEYSQLFHPKQSMIARGENKSGTESYGTSSATVSLSISGTTNSAGSGGSHENRPPYYALCYIMKT